MRVAGESAPQTHSDVDPRVARPFAAFPLPPDPDPAELIACHYLEVGSSLIITGPTGVGKTSLENQMSVCFSLGRPFLGLQPVRPLRILTFQAEQSDADLGYSRAGIFEGLKLTEEERAEVMLRYWVANHTGRTGQSFIDNDLVPALLTLESNMFCLDPLFAFAGCDFKDQAAITSFLRGGLQPVLRRFKCAMAATHHANKPPSDKATHRRGWNELDFAYAGSGTIELSNWTRAAIHIEPTKTAGIFKVTYGKRRNRLKAPIEFIRHCDNPDRPFWVEVLPEEAKAMAKPPVVAAREKLMARMAVGEKYLKDSVKHWSVELNVARDVLRTAIEESIEAGEMVESEERKGRGIIKYLARV